MARTLEQAESQIARMAREVDTHRNGHAYWYERCRLLENAIRDAATQSDTFVDRSQALANLLRRVPKHPRKKYAMGRFARYGRRR